MTAPSAKAFTSWINANPGDLFFGVRDSSGSVPISYLIDLGTPPPSSSTVVTSLATDLSNLYGAGWYTNTNLHWGIIGYEGSNLIDVSKVESTFGVQSAPYALVASGTRNTITGQIDTVYSQGSGGSDSNAAIQTAGFPFGGYSSTGGGAFLSSDPGGWGNSAAGGFTSFGANFEGAGFSNVALDMYHLTNSVNTYQGNFTVTSGGNVVYTAPVAAPEPGHASLFGLGLVGLLFRRRRGAVV